MIPSFIEERLLDEMAYGFSGGPTYNTLITSLRSGVQRRKIQRTRPLHRFAGSFDRREDAVVEQLLDAYHATYGAAVGFRFKNWLDYEATAEVIGVATGALQSLQLIKTYKFGTSANPVPIRKPVQGEVQLFANGTPIASTTNTSTGLVTFSAAAGHVISWTGEFDLPVSFDSDEFVGQIDTYGASTINVQLIEDISA